MTATEDMTVREIVANDFRTAEVFQRHGIDFCCKGNTSIEEACQRKNIMTEDVESFFSRRTGRNLTPVFEQYLRHTALPVLELKFADGSVSYRWKVDEQGFVMPIRVGAKGNWQIIQPTTEWQTMKTALAKDQFEVATDLYFVEVSKL